MALPAGTQVRFTANNLGLTKEPYLRQVEPDMAMQGDTGEYVEPHRDLMDKGWHVVKIGELYCPCHESHFEVIS